MLPIAAGAGAAVRGLMQSPIAKELGNNALQGLGQGIGGEAVNKAVSLVTGGGDDKAQKPDGEKPGVTF